MDSQSTETIPLHKSVDKYYSLSKQTCNRKKRGIWNISNITDIFLSSCFWNHFQLTFYPYELLIHLPYKDALEGWWLFFFLPSNAKFSSSSVGAFVSFKEFIFFFSPSCNLYTSLVLRTRRASNIFVFPQRV